ncbi:MAG TPA: hypothetical protein VGP76_00650 [Planctomycetaceae bacterium]|jgi:hypothetical protein|nr:hypothetical protein [Planctomycetaceae bacterium]
MTLAPPRIDANAVYTDGDLRLSLDLTSATTSRARRTGRLRYTRQGRTILYRGLWVLDWLERESKPEATPCR